MKLVPLLMAPAKEDMLLIDEFGLRIWNTWVFHLSMVTCLEVGEETWLSLFSII